VTAARLVLHEARYDQKVFRRDPQAVFFTAGLPLLYLFVFVTIFGDQHDRAYGLPESVKVSTILVPGIVAIGIVSAAFQNLAATLVQERESGMLKRVRSAPVPPWAFIAGRTATSVATALLLAAVLLVFGRVFFGVQIPGARMPALLLAIVVATAAFCCLGFAFTAVVMKATATAPMAAAVTLTLYFISGNFFSVNNVPGWMKLAADIFPVKHLNEALFTAIYPGTRGLGVEWLDLAVVAAWGLAGLAIAVRRFRWAPTAST